MIPLRVRSSFSLLKGTASPAELCRQARQYGYQTMALTDQENLYGLWAFLAACRREEIRPVIGAELQGGAAEPVVLLVCSDIGYTNLCNLITRAKKTGAGVPWETDAGLFQGLVLLVKNVRLLETLYERGLQVVADLGSRPTEGGGKLRKRAAALGVPAVATPDSDLAHRDQYRLRLLLRAIESGTIIPSGEKEAHPALVARSLERPEIYQQRFAVWPEALKATWEVAEMCSFSGPRFGIVMPPWQRSSGTRPIAVRVIVMVMI